MGGEILIPGSSKAFAVADHQIAHIYIRDEKLIPEIKALLEKVDGVDRILDEEGKKEFHLNHHRSGEVVAIADEDDWFYYYYWLVDRNAPDVAPTVDIHTYHGYDQSVQLVDL